MAGYSPRRLRMLRESRRLSLSDVTKLTGISRAQISRIENDKVDPRMSTIGALLDCYGADLCDLITPATATATVTLADVMAWAEEGTNRIATSGLGESDPVARLERKQRLGLVL